MIYFVSSVAVLYCPSEQTQRHTEGERARDRQQDAYY